MAKSQSQILFYFFIYLLNPREMLLLKSSMFPLNSKPLQIKMIVQFAAGLMNCACACFKVSVENLSQYAASRLEE